MDNFRFDLTSEGDLSLPMRIIFRRETIKAEGYLVHKDKGLVFFGYVPGMPPEGVKLPFKLDAPGAADFARRWLAEQDYGKEPDHDGHNGRGWRIYTEDWGQVGGWTGSICAVKPAWAMYGK